MIKLNDKIIILDSSECNNELDSISFNKKIIMSKNNPALKIDFTNNLKYNISFIQELIYFEENGFTFGTKYNGYTVKYIISNYTDEIIQALQAISISDKKAKITFIYDCIFNKLDTIWEKSNPCKFCDNMCIAARNNKAYHEFNGCCYSFKYSEKLFTFIEDIQLCKYLGEDKRCTTQNLSCKLFVCNYLRKEKIFKINIKDFLLIQSFFTKKQKLIITNNYFKSKEEIIEKLLEKNNTPYLHYYLSWKYRI